MHAPRRLHHLTISLIGLWLAASACGADAATSTTPVEPAATPTTTAAVAGTNEPPQVTTPDVDPPATTEPAPVDTPDTTTSTIEPADVPEAAPTTTVPPVPGPLAGADDLAAAPDAPDPDPIDDLALDDEPGPCTLPAMPADAVIGDELWFDLGEGNGDHRVVGYLADGTWKLRVEFSFGAASEVEVPGAGVHGVRPIGFADVDLTFGGEELLAVVGGGASTVEVGVFAFLEGGCIHRYQSDLGGDFGVLVGASVGAGEGLYCGDGYLVDWGYQLQADDTYTRWSAAFEPVSLPVFGYVPASDDYAEGLGLDEVTSAPLFDCHGLGL